jgi:hypothetical protein
MLAMKNDPSLIDTNRRRGEGRRGEREERVDRFQQMDNESRERREAREREGGSSGGGERSRRSERNLAENAEIEERVEDIEFIAIPDSVLIAEKAEDNSMFEVQFETTEETSLFMIPRLLNITMDVDVDTLLFGKNILTSLQGEAEIKDEYLRLNQFRLFNGGGRMDIDMAYRAKSLQEGNVWIDVKIEKTDIQELLKLYPELDTMMPITRSFEGLIDCSLTASATLDSAMDVDLDRTKATCNLRGEKLVFLDGETFTQIAKPLMFKNKDRNLIDSLSVDLIVDDGKIEIFPFKLSMDRYDFAVGGTQNLDMSFNYHITVLQSPVPFKLGIDVYGTTERFRYRIVSPKFRRMDSPAISIELRDRTLNAQQELRRILDYELSQITGQTEN